MHRRDNCYGFGETSAGGTLHELAIAVNILLRFSYTSFLSYLAIFSSVCCCVVPMSVVGGWSLVHLIRLVSTICVGLG